MLPRLIPNALKFHSVEGGVVRNFYLIEYGGMLFDECSHNSVNSSLWTQALPYFEECRDPQLAMGQLEVRLLALPLVSDAIALRILHVAKQQSLNEVGTFPCGFWRSTSKNRFSQLLW
jgi:hypothetical protein